MVELVVGMKAPEFSLPDHNLGVHSLSELKNKWLVLYFYPKDNTPGCTIEAHDFSVLKPDFQKVDGVIWGVSPDSSKSHCSFMDKQGLSITLLSDEKKEVIGLYGVWGIKKFMGRQYEGVLRSTFLIDPHGKIAHMWREVSVKGHAAEVLEKLKMLKK